MTEANPKPAELDAATRAELERVRLSGALGAQGRLNDLFEYLAGRMLDARSPKEAEIALAVFGKTENDANRDDPAVRVYIHRLRKRLEDHYLRSSSPNDRRLTIPKGEYRLVAVSAETRGDAVAQPMGSSQTARETGLNWKKLAAPIAAIALAVGAGAGWAANSLSRRPDPIERTSVWRGMASVERPVLIVLGDYYMFGEYEDRLFLKRLVRDFAINSKNDLLNQYLSQPGMSDRYGDVALSYLPTSSGYALAELSPLLNAASRREIILASELTPDRLKEADVIYIGLLSGMASLKDTVFSHSSYSIGESYDDILDEKSGRTYRSEAFLAAPSDSMYRDYAYMASFAGPSGNRISVLAGARDTGLLGLAEMLSQRDGVTTLTEASGGVPDFEALLEVRGQKHVNLEARVVSASSIDSRQVWQGDRRASPVYPQE